MGNAEVQKLYQDYKAKFGDYPSPDADPWADQLASLRQVVTAGSVPYAEEADLHLLHPERGHGGMV